MEINFFKGVLKAHTALYEAFTYNDTFKHQKVSSVIFFWLVRN
jgi:hypothetical protein